MRRIAALLGKELADLRSNPAVFVPAIITGFFSIVMPFMVAVAVPYFTGERLSDSSDFAIAAEMYQREPASRHLDPEGAIQAMIFQQFLILLVLTPVAASMSVAAYAVVGEKQARTLEPLLATPITTFELLAAKILGALIPGMILAIACFTVYVGGAALLANQGVYQTLLVPRALLIMFALGPLAALAALEMAVCVSSRVNDARSAQKFGALIILPISGLLVAEFTNNLQLTIRLIGVICVVLAVLDAVLMSMAIRLFDRESILTRWT
jgi:ABC-2 type transport system permease protein